MQAHESEFDGIKAGWCLDCANVTQGLLPAMPDASSRFLDTLTFLGFALRRLAPEILDTLPPKSMIEHLRLFSTPALHEELSKTLEGTSWCARLCPHTHKHIDTQTLTSDETTNTHLAPTATALLTAWDQMLARGVSPTSAGRDAASRLAHARLSSQSVASEPTSRIVRSCWMPVSNALSSAKAGKARTCRLVEGELTDRPWPFRRAPRSPSPVCHSAIPLVC